MTKKALGVAAERSACCKTVTGKWRCSSNHLCTWQGSFQHMGRYVPERKGTGCKERFIYPAEEEDSGKGKPRKI